MTDKILSFPLSSLTIIPIPIEKITYDNKKLSNSKLKEVIIGYLSNELEVKTQLQSIPNNHILPGSILNEYVKLKQQLIIQWYHGINEKIELFKQEIKINSIEEVNNLIRVDLINIINLQYENCDVETNYINNHILYLKNIDDDLFIEKDIFEADTLAKDIDTRLMKYNHLIKDYSNENYIIYMNKKINYINAKLNSINEDINTLKKHPNKVCNNSNNYNSKNSIPRKYSNYDGNLAASWALENVYSPEDYVDDDCTNFISKSLNAGGLPTDKVWFKGSNAWIRVLELRNWLVNKGYATEYKVGSNCKIGDVVQLYNENYSNWRHSLLITHINNKTNSNILYVSAHTIPVLNKPLFEYYPENPNYTNIRYLKITP